MGDTPDTSGLLFPQRRIGNAFSLVEVVLALGLFTFALVAILGLFPTGLRSYQTSAQENRALALLEQIAADIRLTDASSGTSPLYGIDVPLETATSGSSLHDLYFDANWQKTTSPGNALYRVSLWFEPPAAQPSGDAHGAQRICLRAVWPAAAPAGKEAAGVDLVTAFVP